jgi:hypothetical protein
MDSLIVPNPIKVMEVRFAISILAIYRTNGMKLAKLNMAVIVAKMGSVVEPIAHLMTLGEVIQNLTVQITNLTEL